MKQGRILSHTEYFYLICVMLLGTYYTVHYVFLSEPFPNLNGFWETADQWGSDNWCSTVFPCCASPTQVVDEPWYDGHVSKVYTKNTESPTLLVVN